MTTSPDVLSLTETIELSRIIVRPFARITAALVAARARQADHRTYTYLLEADEYVLRDIGLTRPDVRRALHECDRR